MALSRENSDISHTKNNEITIQETPDGKSTSTGEQINHQLTV